MEISKIQFFDICKNSIELLEVGELLATEVLAGILGNDLDTVSGSL